MTRIVSLLPSATEIVAALGAGDRLVGRSHECDFPAGIEDLPVCTAPRLDPSASSRDIDRAVKDALRDALAVYDVFADRLRELAPDVIVTQDQCDVCAVALADVERAVAGWTGAPATIVSLNPSDVAAVHDDIIRVGAAIGAGKEADALVASMRARAATIAEKTVSLPTTTVACVEWADPLMAAGNWVPELVAQAGGRDVFGTPGEHAPWIEWDSLRQADPEVIVFMPCGFGLGRCRDEATLTANRPGWTDLSAVRSGRVCITDGNSYFNRPGPRLAESLEIMAEILHPDAFAFGHGVSAGGAGWDVFGNRSGAP